MKRKGTFAASIQASSVSAAAALYVVGAFVTAIHLSNLDIYDLSLTKVTYFFAGGACIFYLLHRLLIAAIIIDYKILCRSFLVFDVMRLGPISAEAPGAEKRSWRSLLPLQFVSALPVFYLITLIALPVILIYYRVLDLSGINVRFAWIGKPVAAVKLLVIYQVVIILVFLLRRPMGRSDNLRRLWWAMLALMALADVILYSAAVHPLVRPTFGGGRAVHVRLIPKDDSSERILVRYLGSGDKSGHGAFVIHETSSHLYVATRFRLNYSASSIGRVIERGPIFRIKRDLLAGFIIEPRSIKAEKESQNEPERAGG